MKLALIGTLLTLAPAAAAAQGVGYGVGYPAGVYGYRGNVVAPGFYTGGWGGRWNGFPQRGLRGYRTVTVTASASASAGGYAPAYPAYPAYPGYQAYQTYQSYPAYPAAAYGWPAPVAAQGYGCACQPAPAHGGSYGYAPYGYGW